MEQGKTKTRADENETRKISSSEKKELRIITGCGLQSISRSIKTIRKKLDSKRLHKICRNNKLHNKVPQGEYLNDGVIQKHIQQTHMSNPRQYRKKQKNK